MWAQDRHHLILSQLHMHGQLSLERLAEELGSSRETLRRDIVQLEAEGRLRRVRGGIMRVEDGAEPPFRSRLSAHAEAKRRIGAAAARLVEPGMLCAVDAGSTTLAFGAYLAALPDVTVLTNSLELAAAVRAGSGRSRVILVGGELAADVPGTYGGLALAQLRRFSPDLAFFSPVGLSATHGAMDYDLDEADFARAMTEVARRVVVLADHSKLGNPSRVQVCGCDCIDILITDRKAATAVTTPLLEAGVHELITA